MARLFVAVWPPEEVLDRVAALPRPEGNGLRWTGRHHWHVTLRFLGEVADFDSVARAVAEAGAQPADAVLGPAVGRFGNRVLHVPVSGLDRLASSVVDATRNLGRPPEDRPFAGHLTLARVAKGARVDLRGLTGDPIDGHWPVDEVCVVQSRLSPSGARYELLERVSLR